MPRTYDKDPYAILGIHPTATASQIKQAYHLLARQYHPDLNKDPRAVDRMKDINWANDILSDPQERSLYDLWRSSSVRTIYYYPGTGPSSSKTTPPQHSPSSTSGQSRSTPPYNPPPRTAYSYDRVTVNSRAQGCFTTMIAWLIITSLITMARGIGSVNRTVYNPPMENMATRTARMARLDAAIDTLHAAQTLSTPGGTDTSLLFWILFTASPTDTAVMTSDGDLRSSFVPGSWGWNQVHTYFPELTTPYGLSDEVTLIIYDQLLGYQIKTRSSGEYWLYINPDDNSVAPAHFPLTATGTPAP